MLLTKSKKRALIACDIVLLFVLCAVYAQPAYTYIEPQSFWAWGGVVLLTLMLTFGTTTIVRVLGFLCLYVFLEACNFRNYLLTGVSPWSYSRIRIIGFNSNTPERGRWPEIIEGLRFASFNEETNRFEPKAAPQQPSEMLGYSVHNKDKATLDQRLKDHGLYLYLRDA